MKYKFNMHEALFVSPEEDVDILGATEERLAGKTYVRWNIYRYINGEYCTLDEYGWLPSRRPTFWFELPSLDELYAAAEQSDLGD